jgi:hypothetical protein
MKYIPILALVAVLGCQQQLPSVQENCIRVHTLDQEICHVVINGMNCVSMDGFESGAITCNWK